MTIWMRDSHPKPIESSRFRHNATRQTNSILRNDTGPHYTARSLTMNIAQTNNAMRECVSATSSCLRLECAPENSLATKAWWEDLRYLMRHTTLRKYSNILLNSVYGVMNDWILIDKFSRNCHALAPTDVDVQYASFSNLAPTQTLKCHATVRIFAPTRASMLIENNAMSTWNCTFDHRKWTNEEHYRNPNGALYKTPDVAKTSPM